LIRFTE